MPDLRLRFAPLALGILMTTLVVHAQEEASQAITLQVSLPAFATLEREQSIPPATRAFGFYQLVLEYEAGQPGAGRAHLQRNAGLDGPAADGYLERIRLAVSSYRNGEAEQTRALCTADATAMTPESLAAALKARDSYLSRLQERLVERAENFPDGRARHVTTEPLTITAAAGTGTVTVDPLRFMKASGVTPASYLSRICAALSRSY